MSARFLFLISAALTGCAPDSTAFDSEDRAALSAEPRTFLVQAGTQLLLWGVTDDNYAIYQDGTALYSTRLEHNAQRELIAELGGNTPFVLTDGEVAFVWTNYAPSGSIVAPVSPLIVWTAQGGPQLASMTSIVATLGVAVSGDSRQVAFIANATVDGTTGDLVSADSELSAPRLLAAGVSTDYNTQGTPTNCRPFLGFAGPGRSAFPVAGYCEPGVTNATLSTWVDGVRTDLLTGLALPPLWHADPSGRFFLTTRASATSLNRGAPIVVRDDGTPIVADDVVTSPFFVALNRDGSFFDIALSPTSRELRRVTKNGATTIADLGTSFRLPFHIHNGQGGYFSDFRFVSKDGALLMYLSAINPATGTGNVSLLDVSGGSASPIGVSSNLDAVLSSQPYSADSSHGLFYVVDFNTGLGAFYAANLGGARLLSDGATSAFNNHPGRGSVVSFTERTQLNFTSFVFSTADVAVVDLARAEQSPVVIAEQAYLGHLPSHGGRGVVYTSDHDPGHRGLFLGKL
jgi:hypothetical protein